ncbi:MAG: archaellin/type IV pilin N-terminal domain-containing protein [Thermoplasmata archaeon]
MSPKPRNPVQQIRFVSTGSRRRGRAVSPVIAVILLVAITVVLAAVLYVLVAGSVHGSAEAPLGSALGLGPATALTGSKTTASYCASGHGCYIVSIATAAPSLTLGDVAFVVKQSASGPDQTVLKGTGQFYVDNSAGVEVAHSASIAKGKPVSVSAWTYAKGYSADTAWSSQLTLSIEFGTGISNPAGHGFVLEADGLGAFQGTVLFSLP